MTLDDATTGRLFAPLGRLMREMAAVAYLDARRGLLGCRHLPGARDWLHLPIRLVAQDALALDARAVVVAHNHPSGDARASAADLAFTRRLALGLDAIEVRLLDHLVVAGSRMTSLRAEGYL
jgi:DNA repair protein RadC